MLNEGWALLSVVGFWGWAGAVVGLALTSFPVQGRFSSRPASIWGSGVIFFFVLWIVAMLHA
jgi:hypothetical protein